MQRYHHECAEIICDWVKFWAHDVDQKLAIHAFKDVDPVSEDGVCERTVDQWGNRMRERQYRQQAAYRQLFLVEGAEDLLWVVQFVMSERKEAAKYGVRGREDETVYREHVIRERGEEVAKEPNVQITSRLKMISGYCIGEGKKLGRKKNQGITNAWLRHGRRLYNCILMQTWQM